MRGDTLKKIVLSRQDGSYIFFATADKAGRPHIAAAGDVAVTGEDMLSVTSWFCPASLANIAENRNVTVVMWDFLGDAGFQLTGQVSAIKEVSMLNGYTAEESSGVPLPQVERQLLIRVSGIMEFSQMPHRDIEIDQ